MFNLGLYFGGAGGSGEACLTVQILQNGAIVQSPCAPRRGCGESYGLRPLLPALDHCSLLSDL